MLGRVLVHPQHTRYESPSYDSWNTSKQKWTLCSFYRLWSLLPGLSGTFQCGRVANIWRFASGKNYILSFIFAHFHSAINRRFWFVNSKMTKIAFFEFFGFKWLLIYWILIIECQKSILLMYCSFLRSLMLGVFITLADL